MGDKEEREREKTQELRRGVTRKGKANFGEGEHTKNWERDKETKSDRDTERQKEEREREHKTT